MSLNREKARAKCGSAEVERFEDQETWRLRNGGEIRRVGDNLKIRRLGDLEIGRQLGD